MINTTLQGHWGIKACTSISMCLLKVDMDLTGQPYIDVPPNRLLKIVRALPHANDDDDDDDANAANMFNHSARLIIIQYCPGALCTPEVPPCAL